MASITHFHEVLQRQWFQKIKFIGEYLRPQDLTEAAAAAGYHWRDRLWPPMQMLWAFLVQVLHPGWSGARGRGGSAGGARGGRPAPGSLAPIPRPTVKHENACRSRCIGTPCGRSDRGSKRRSARPIAGAAGACGWWMGPVARCRIRRNSRRPSDNRPGKRKAVVFRWPSSSRCSAGPAARCSMWRSERTAATS